MKKAIHASVAAVALFLGVDQVARGGKLSAKAETHARREQASVGDSGRGPADLQSLSALDANGFNGIQEIGKTELVQLMSKSRPLSQDESTNLSRGCLGLTCV